MSLVGVLLTIAASAQDQSSDKLSTTHPAIDANEVARVGRASLERLKTAPADWRVEVSRGPATFIIDRLQAGTRSRCRAHVLENGRDVELWTTLEIGGECYASEFGRRLGKYRRWEAPLSITTAYLFMQYANAQFVTDSDSLAGFSERSREGSIVTGRIELPLEQRTLIETTIRSLRSVLPELPAKDQADRTREIDALEDVLRAGTEVSVDLSTGMICAHRSPQVSWRVKTFRWLEEPLAEKLAIDGAYEDHTRRIPSGEMPDWIMIAHYPTWRKEHETKEDPDGRLLNIKTGEVRRIPYEGACSMPGSFSADRSRAFVAGFEEGLFVPFQIDLRSGENKRFAILKDYPRCLGTILSHDGHSLAMTGMPVQFSSGHEALKFQTIVVDVERNVARKIGVAQDCMVTEWYPDDSALLIECREHVEKETKRSIARLALDGGLTIVCPGSDGHFVKSGSRILFQDPDQLWYTCALDGSDARMVGDGLRRHGSPGPAADGGRAIFTNYDAPQGPTPVIVDLTTGKTSSIPAPPGLWRRPVWR